MAKDAVMKLGLILSATDKCSRVVDEVTKKFKNLDKVGKAFQKTGAYMFAGGSAILGGLAVNFNSVAEKAKELRLETAKIGMNMESFETFKVMAGKTGVATDALTASIARLEKAQGMAATGSKKQAQIFKMAGISIFDQNGKLKKSENVLTELSDKFSKTPDGVKKTTIAMLLFGRTGKDMIPMLNKGPASLKNLQAELKQTGNLLTSDQINGFKHYTEQMGHVKLSVLGLKTQLAVSLLPKVTELIDKITEVATKASDWIGKNKELFNSIVKWTGKIGVALITLGAFNMVVGTVIRSIKNIKAVLEVLKLVTKENIVATIQWSIALMTNPITWIVVGVMALIAVLVICWKKFATFRAVILTTWETIKGFGTILKDYVLDRIKGIISGLGSMGKAISLLFDRNFKGAYEEAKNGVKALSGYDAKMKAVTRTKELATSITGKYTTILAQEKAKDEKPKSTQAVEAMNTNIANNRAINSSKASINYNPTINISGATVQDKESFRKILDDHKRDIEQFLTGLNNNNSRLSYS